MKKLMIPLAVGSLAVVLAACGGSSSSSKQTGASALVDTHGLALYSPDNESAGNVRCTGACTAIWKPVRPGAVAAAAASSLGKVATITRPDGSKQVTAAGKPLYTFAQDTPGAVTGNGASDSFGSQQFTWHVVTAKGAAPAPMPSGGGGASSGY